MWVFNDRDKFVSYYPEKIADEDGKPIITADQIPTENAELFLFKLMFSENLMKEIIKESDENFRKKLKKQYGENYATKEYAKNSLPDVFLKNGGLKVEDLQAYIGCLLFMGILHLPRLNNYWSLDKMYQNFLPRVMSKNFFKMISAVLHLPISGNESFVDDDDDDEEEDEKNTKDDDDTLSKKEDSKMDLTDEGSNSINYEDGNKMTSSEDNKFSSTSDVQSVDGNKNNDNSSSKKPRKRRKKKEINYEDPRIKVNHYLQSIVGNGQKVFKCGRDLTIDESMIHFEGRSSLIFYMPAKPTKWGFKLHCLVDSKTHYFYNFIFDPGQNYKNLIIEDEEISFTENIVLSLLQKLEGQGHRVFFDSWYSSVSLIEKLTDKGFQVISTLRNNSKNLPSKSEFNKNSKNFAYCNEMRALIQKYSDKKDIYFISNYDVPMDDMRNTYNFQNRGVDKMNENMSFYNIERRVLKWWKKIFFFGIEISITNAKILHDKFFDSYAGYDQLAFRKNLIMQLVQGYCRSSVGEVLYQAPGVIPQKYVNLLHNMSFAPGQRRCCINCFQKGKKEVNAMYKCDQCHKALHPQCFLEWHKKNVYSL